MPGVPQEFCISLGNSSLHPTSSQSSLSSVTIPAGAQVGTSPGPQDPRLCWELSCDPVTRSRLPGRAEDTEWDSHSRTSANAALQQHLGPPGSAGQLWDVGNVGQRMLGNIWKIWLMIQLRTSLLTVGPLNTLFNPNYSMRVWNISLLNSGIKPTLWI